MINAQRLNYLQVSAMLIMFLKKFWIHSISYQGIFEAVVVPITYGIIIIPIYEFFLMPLDKFHVFSVIICKIHVLSLIFWRNFHSFAFFWRKSHFFAILAVFFFYYYYFKILTFLSVIFWWKSHFFLKPFTKFTFY